MDKDQIICYCKNVTKKEIERAIKNGAETLSDIQTMTKAFTGIESQTLNPKGRCCNVDIFEILKEQFGDIGSCPCCKH